MKVIGLMEKGMDKVQWYTRIKTVIKDNGNKIKEMDMEHMHVLMGNSIQVNGSIIIY